MREFIEIRGMKRTVGRKVAKKLLIAGAGFVATYGIMKIVARKRTESTDIDMDNPYIKEDAHTASRRIGMYEGVIKPVLDQILSFGGLLVLSPLYGMIALAIKIDDPGPIFFIQKRVGKDKRFFYCHKFRSMRMDTPHDVPTHQLESPDLYITRVGKILRRTSLDELPQIWDIFRSKMSIIGPRPALWNQDDLIAEREKYGANDLIPGLTGLAQISGRDELEIPDKARIDGEYVNSLSFGTDFMCFIGTIKSVFKHDGVVEGGTGSINCSRPIEPVNPAEVGFEYYGYKKIFNIDKSVHRKVLITGKGSYIGESFKSYCENHYPNIECSTIDMVGGTLQEMDFRGFDTVFHVAGIAHADVEETSVEQQENYYRVNTDLAIETAYKAKENGCSQFIFMSSMIVYGGAERIGVDTIPQPASFYGNSKWLADKGVREIGDEKFKVAVLRPPMIYGKGSKGNYPTLSKLAKKVPVFPAVDNKRSMLYIENLCEFVALLTLSGENGVYFPQNKEFSNTSEIVNLIGKYAHRWIWMSKAISPAVSIAMRIPGKIQILAGKAFESSYYDQKLSVYKGLDYCKVGLEESIARTEASQKNEKEYNDRHRRCRGWNSRICGWKETRKHTTLEEEGCVP